MQIPLINLPLNKPTRGSLAWYTGLGVMAAAGVVEWPLALVVGAGHLVSDNARSPEVQGAAGGVESAAG